jgi:hypothetical protein
MPGDDPDDNLTPQQRKDQELYDAYKRLFRDPVPIVYLRHLKDPRPAIRKAIRTRTPIPSRLGPGEVT